MNSIRNTSLTAKLRTMEVGESYVAEGFREMSVRVIAYKQKDRKFSVSCTKPDYQIIVTRVA